MNQTEPVFEPEFALWARDKSTEINIPDVFREAHKKTAYHAGFLGGYL
jgi:hypothetical protein